MLVLGGWALGNIAIGSVMVGQQEGRGKYFHQMNIGWGAVNLGIASFAYLSAYKANPGDYDIFQTINEQYSLQKILLFNAGLDLAYMASGAYLIERSKNVENRPERLKGFGQSILLQGAFLFVFDIGTYLIQNSHNKSLQPLLEGLSFQGTGIGLNLNF